MTNKQKTFEFASLPENMQEIVRDLTPALDFDDSGLAPFKIITLPNPEFGNIHIPLSLYLIKQGASKGETVYIEREKY